MLRKPQITLITLIAWHGQAAIKSLIINHECTRMNTNFDSPLNTQKKQKASQTGRLHF